MYAKIENGEIKFPPKHLKENGRYVANYNHHDEELLADGWIKVEESQPEEKDGFSLVCRYVAKNGKIVQEWEYVEITEEEEL